ncbi:twin transmembrane helix small protein [Sphingomonas sp. ID1715]|uniref:twin transmembrane helix small protein n=1 Tax=Sphingomonas sp. ID1715 TaxID=1656898 RepID=UPI001488EFEF|nr:twin transmembrane helix small protein [Sphingomonas sp. ID1715]NNM77359.1 twin transmembrane helix small protein [Sphingomonas sp. ID1715]
MSIFLTLLLVAAMIATVTMLVRGIVTFLKTTEADLKSGNGGPSASGLKQNKMMMGRIFFQAIAVLIAALLMLLSR